MFKSTLPLLAAFAVITSLPASAITESDLAPTALAGKTLIFTITTGAPPFATSGSWTGEFGSSPGNHFKMTKVSGNTVNIDGTWNFNSSNSGLYEYTLSPFIAGQPNGVLTLWISGGAGRYEVFLNGVFGNSQTGAFTIGASPKLPEIDVRKTARKSLKDGVSEENFGEIKVGGGGKSKTFTITNTGKARLIGISLRRIGLARNDFIVTSPLKSNLAPGASTSFRVTFRPKTRGVKRAVLAIDSNDSDENPFNIKLAGEGKN